LDAMPDAGARTLISNEGKGTGETLIRFPRLCSFHLLLAHYQESTMSSGSRVSSAKRSVTARRSSR
jgi:hypothetical protein